MTVETCLHTSFENPDREYRDGRLVRRSFPDNLHSRAHGAVAALFGELRSGLSVYPAPSIRLKLRERLYLVPDVAVFHPIEPLERIPERPPLIVIEVLSLDDEMTALREKLEEYRTWGVAHVWLIDPYSKRLYTCDAGLVEVSALKIPELGIEVKPADIFE